MPNLAEISESVQQVAEAIGLAMGVEVEIVDHQLTIVGGTGNYTARIGQQEEFGQLDSHYLYGRVLKSGKTEFIEDVMAEADYDPLERGYELAEVCTCIKINNQIIGIIGLVAANENQRKILLEKKKSMILFVEKMADLLAAKADQSNILKKTESVSNEIMTILETVHEGVIAVDSKGYIKHCNSNAETLLNSLRSDIVGSHINLFMESTNILDVIKTGEGYIENEETYKTDRGSFHFIVTARPFHMRGKVEGVVVSFRDIEEAQKLVYNLSNKTSKYTFNDIIGDSDAINKSKSMAIMTSRTSSTVLITGESGTGKEMFAKAVHYASPRAKGPFITVNCGAIPENLLESELFGYEKGAFTGALDKGKIGKFEQADKGTIFLDEIGDMPLHLQVKILHVLQNMKFERVGGNKTIATDVRVIAATNRNLEEMIKEGKFREDLYYRLSVIPLFIPPLRVRKKDIVYLATHFLKKYKAYMNKEIDGFTEEAMEVFLNYEWPGNVRELENSVEYGVNMACKSKIDIEDIPLRILNKDEKNMKVSNTDAPLSDQIRHYEREIIMKKLEEYKSVQNAKEKIAKDLGLSKATLYRKLIELSI